MRALQGEREQREESDREEASHFNDPFERVMVEADKRTALAQGNPVLKVNHHVIPFKMNPTIINKCGKFHNSDSNGFGRLTRS